jgi:hypothetical protein
MLRNKGRYEICRAVCPASNPDWRAPYTYTESLTDEAMAFEFLRRSPVYWEAFTRAVGCCPGQWPNYFRPIGKREASTVDDFDRFGLSFFCDPRTAIDVRGPIPWSMKLSLAARYRYTMQSFEKDEGTFFTFGPNPPADTVSIEFRAIGPIEEQLAFARWTLRRVQRQLDFDPRSAPRFNRRKFPQHLQILDALDAGATYEEIKSRLFGNRRGAKDRLRKQARAAREFRDNGYKDLVFWGTLLPKMQKAWR